MGFSELMAQLRGYTAVSPYSTSLGETNEGGEGFRRFRRARLSSRRLIYVLGGSFVALLLFHVGSVFRRMFDCGPTGICSQDSSHSWGQYSPFFSVPSEIDPAVPNHCEITFAQVLSRHGSRDPTAGKSAEYAELIIRIHDLAKGYGGGFEWIRDYKYTLGADQLTLYGQKEMTKSGTAFYQRYKTLTRDVPPFIRVSGQDRVIMSGLNWTEGFYDAKLNDGRGDSEEGSREKERVVTIPESSGMNNTLNHGLCRPFEEGKYSHVGDDAKDVWRDVFIPPIMTRMNRNLPGVNLSAADTVYLMDLCPYNTVADPTLRRSRFCDLFTMDEWQAYDYYQSVGKYYGFNEGNAMAATQGVGFVNELIARLTDRPVEDHTTTNSTLDGDDATFPLGRQLYADFSHDNDMLTVYAALGLYSSIDPLPKTRRVPARLAGGFSAGWTVPFAGRMYVEKMRCGAATGQGEKKEEELVRILVNDRVVPLVGCGADGLGRCRLGAFVESLRFAREGGKWEECFE